MDKHHFHLVNKMRWDRGIVVSGVDNVYVMCVIGSALNPTGLLDNMDMVLEFFYQICHQSSLIFFASLSHFPVCALCAL